MKYHTTSDGQIGICHAEVRACPVAVSSEHFDTTADAARFVVARELKASKPFFADLDENWNESPVSPWLDSEDDYETFMGEPTPDEATYRTVPQPLKKERKEDLNLDFSAYLASPAARAEAVDRGDWRAQQASDAERNGDHAADKNPNTSTFGYYDATPDEDEDEDLSMFEPF